MSWAKVLKINKNVKKAINEQLTDREFNIGQLITASTNWVVPKTGIYKIICVGAGAEANISNRTSGGAGGVVVEKAILKQGDTYSITISGSSSFGDLCTANQANGWRGGDGITTNGVVYVGGNGAYEAYIANGGNVGLFDKRYTTEADVYPIGTEANAIGGNGLFGQKRSVSVYSLDGIINYAATGAGGFGGGGACVGNSYSGASSSAGGACVYIELVEEQ